MLGRLSRLSFGVSINRCEVRSTGLSIGWRSSQTQFVSLRYDNEAGKGDYRHIGSAKTRYKFVDAEILLADFWNDVEAWRR
jgi:hypothetical protein